MERARPSPASPGSPLRRAPWEASGGDVHRDRGKAPPKERRHKLKPEAGRLMANDHLESEQLEHARQVLRTKRADSARHAREHEKQMSTRSSLLREASGSRRRRAAQQRGAEADPGAGHAPPAVNDDLAPRKEVAQASSRWAEPRKPGGSRKVVAEKGVRYRQLKGMVYPPTAVAQAARDGVPTPAPVRPPASHLGCIHLLSLQMCTSEDP